MQSILQYRRLGHVVEAQWSKDRKQHTAMHGVYSKARGCGEELEERIIGQVFAAVVDTAPELEKAYGLEGDKTIHQDNHIPQCSVTGASTSETSSDAVKHPQTDRSEESREHRAASIIIVDFEGDGDALDPHNWSWWTRVRATVNIAMIGFIVGVASSIDSSVTREAAAEFGVSEVVESMAIGLFLVSFGLGALAAGPLSETLGRNPVYIGSLSLCMVFILASALAPNIGAQLAFRFLAGFFASTPMTTGGGSLADMWDATERIYTFPIFANAAFMGPVLGPVCGGWIAQKLYWRWTEWFTLIGSAVVLGLVVLTQPETYPGIILSWKASHLRSITGDQRYAARLELQSDSFLDRLRTALCRPFVMTAQEPIIILIALYLMVIYIILFTFFNGYDFIFGQVHGTSQGITGTCFLGIAIGLCLASLPVPLIYRWAKNDLAKMKADGLGGTLPPEFRLRLSMLGGSFAIPVSLFWMGWTSYPSASIWSPLAASVLFGYGTLTVFISTYQYMIDVYETYAASALAAVTVLRYVAAGGMTVVGIPFYENLGVHWTLTILGGISALLVPVPYIFYFYGNRIRGHSKFAAGPKRS